MKVNFSSRQGGKMDFIFHNNQRNYGFTLIEILVAIAIFVMVLGVAGVSYVSANRRARDSRRQSDLEIVRGALEIYRVDDTSHQYPVCNYEELLEILVAGDYINSGNIRDPRPTQFSYCYQSDGSDYSLCAHLEGGSISSPCTVTCSDSCTDACNYCVCSP